MTVGFRRKLEQMDPDRRARIEAEAAALNQEYATLAEIRRRAAVTQVDLAARLSIGQANVSQFEKQDDFMLSTLRRYVEALGGDLRIVVEMPGLPPLEIRDPETAEALLEPSGDQKTAAE